MAQRSLASLLLLLLSTWSVPEKGHGQDIGPRYGHDIVYDEERDQVMLFSGRAGDTMLEDTWSWDGQMWKQLSATGPLKRGIYALMYDRVRHHALFYGSGVREGGQWILDAETWIWEDNVWYRAQ